MREYDPPRPPPSPTRSYATVRMGERSIVIERMTPSHQVRVDAMVSMLTGEEDIAFLRSTAERAQRAQQAAADGDEATLLSHAPSGDDSMRMASILEAQEASAGWYILNMWDDRTWCLETQERYNKREFANAGNVALVAGGACYRELFRAGYSHGEIAVLYQKCREFQAGAYDARTPTREVSAVLDFFVPAPTTVSTPS